jgi:Fe-S-cluster containining protein
MVISDIININNRKRLFREIDIKTIPCLRCGTCCKFFQPRISLAEARSIAEKLNLSWEHFVTEFTDPKWPGIQSFLIRHNQNGCIFLNTNPATKQSYCQIHAFKPACCREWKSGLERSECQKGLKSHWDLRVDSDNQICGTKEQLAALKTYIDTLN